MQNAEKTVRCRGQGARDRLLDDDAPGVGADEDGEEVDQDRHRDPFPLHPAKRALERAGVGAAPDREGDERRDRDENEDQASRAAPRHPELSAHAAALTASAGAASRS